MRNVIYDFDSDTGYACGTCGEPIMQEELWSEDTWHCGHLATEEGCTVTVGTEETR